MRTGGGCRTVGREISRFPPKERPHMPGSLTAPGRLGARADAPGRVAVRKMHCVGTQNRKLAWLARSLRVLLCHCLILFDCDCDVAFPQSFQRDVLRSYFCFGIGAALA